MADIIILNNLLDYDLDDCVECGIGEIPIQSTLLNNKSDPLSEENLETTLELVNKIRLSCPEKSIWLYTGYTWEEIYDYITPFNNAITAPNCDILYDYHMFQRKEIIKQCDVLVDGKYIDSKRDITLHWKGSNNQRVIDTRQSLEEGRIVLHSD